MSNQELDPGICRVCNHAFDLHEGAEPTVICDECLITSLERENAKNRTTLKAISRLHDDEEKENQQLHDEIEQLKTKLAYAEDAAAKGDKARQQMGGMEMENAELRKDICEMYICETEHLALKANQNYRFLIHPDCQRCKQMDESSRVPQALDAAAKAEAR